MADSDSDRELACLRPVLRTAGYLRMDQLVSDPLPTLELAVVWVTVGPGGVLYVRKEQVRRWEADGILWRRTGIGNLQAATRKAVFTHETRRADGSPFWFGMLHADGLGSSRTLLQDGISYYLGDDYYVAVPERSCGVAMAGSLSEAERQQVVSTVVEPCFRNGTGPLSPTLFRPKDLAIPSEWRP